MKPTNKFYTIALLFIGLSCWQAEAQLNIPAHFAYVKGGTFIENSISLESHKNDSYYTKEIAPFYMYRFETMVHTFEQFCEETKMEMPPQPSWSNGLMPVVNVTYDQAVSFCNWLSKKYGMRFRLPTVEEWQYAAKAANFQTEELIYNHPLPNQWVVYSKNARNHSPSCISCMQPNEIGLYAMCGNVWEWTQQQLKGFETSIVGGGYMDEANNVKITSQKPFSMKNYQGDLGFRFVVAFDDFQAYLNKN
ncbi:MAG: hypothetical protein CO119_01400 [Flavobacteriales bacterium CG_4_9_14_3_um_filter_40_17]|nr:MAG: hypothetical protein CO119_01400 [Flavobacteriales bacterium CG_4_9_14_3_um_filter_40_17]